MFQFKPVISTQFPLLMHWFQQSHINKWMHGKGLQNTIDGLQNFFKGETKTSYWIGYDNSTPFAFLITSYLNPEEITLDVFICDLNYLGKGLAIIMIKTFLMNYFVNVKKVHIDPETTNSRAIHVYKKLGFKIVDEFIASWHPVPHYQMELDMEQLKIQKI